MFYSLIRIFASGMENKPRATSYKRRMNGWDYTQPRIYMLTLATEGRQPLFGTLTGDRTLPAAAPEGPHLQPTELGAAVLQEIDGIPRFYPQITIIARQGTVLISPFISAGERQVEEVAVVLTRSMCNNLNVLAARLCE